MFLLRRILIILGIVIGSVTIAIVGGIFLLAYSLTRLDPYPAFMKEFAERHTRTYEETIQAFSRFVVQAFPVGSDADATTKLIALGGFEVWPSSRSDTVHMHWSRRAGVCTEYYSIVIDRTVDGKIAKATGQLRPGCL